MLYGIIADIHGNIEALEAVHKDMQERGVDKVICLGDMVGYGPNPEECLDTVMDMADLVLGGNHDRRVGNGHYRGTTILADCSLRWTQNQLPSDKRTNLLSLPSTEKVDEVMLVTHDEFLNPGSEKYTRLLPRAKETKSSLFLLRGERVQVGFFAHTHKPRVYTLSGGMEDPPNTSYQLGEKDLMLANVGSVGQPRDGDKRACYVLYDTKGTITYRRVPYNFKTTAAKLREGAIDAFIREHHPGLAEEVEKEKSKLKERFGGEETVSGALAWRLENAE